MAPKAAELPSKEDIIQLLSDFSPDKVVDKICSYWKSNEAAGALTAKCIFRLVEGTGDEYNFFGGLIDYVEQQADESVKVGNSLAKTCKNFLFEVVRSAEGINLIWENIEYIESLSFNKNVAYRTAIIQLFEELVHYEHEEILRLNEDEQSEENEQLVEESKKRIAFGMKRLKAHILDVSAFARSRSMQAFLSLAEKDRLSTADINANMKLITGRLLDKTSIVRKFALNLFECVWLKRVKIYRSPREVLETVLIEKLEETVQLLHTENLYPSNWKEKKRWLQLHTQLMAAFKSVTSEQLEHMKTELLKCQVDNAGVRGFDKYIIPNILKNYKSDAYLNIAQLILASCHIFGNHEKIINSGLTCINVESVEQNDVILRELARLAIGCITGEDEADTDDDELLASLETFVRKVDKMVKNNDFDEEITTKASNKLRELKLIARNVRFREASDQALEDIMSFFDSATQSDVLNAIGFFHRSSKYLLSTGILRMVINRLPGIAANHEDSSVRTAAMESYKELFLLCSSATETSHDPKNWTKDSKQLAHHLVNTMPNEAIYSINSFANILSADKSPDANVLNNIEDDVLSYLTNDELPGGEKWKVFFALSILPREYVPELHKKVPIMLDSVMEIESSAKEFYSITFEFLSLLAKIWKPKRRPSDIAPPSRIEWNDTIFKYMTRLICMGAIRSPHDFPGYPKIAEAACTFIAYSCDKPNVLYHRIMCYINQCLNIVLNNEGEEEAAKRLLFLVLVPSYMSIGLSEFLLGDYIGQLNTRNVNKFKKMVESGKLAADKDLQIQASLQFDQQCREQISDWLNICCLKGKNEVFAVTAAATEIFWKTEELQWYGLNKRKSDNNKTMPFEDQLGIMRSTTRAMANYMCVSESYCLEALPHLSLLLKKAGLVEIRSLCVTSMSDVSVRFVNAIQKHFGSIFDALADRNPKVRHIALLSVIRLVLNDLVKVKGKAGRLAYALSDSDPSVAGLAKTFLGQYASRGSVVKVFMPPIMKFLCFSDAKNQPINKDRYQTVMAVAANILEHVPDLNVFLDFIISHIPRVRRDDTAGLLIETLNLFHSKINEELMERLHGVLKKRARLLRHDDIAKNVKQICAQSVLRFAKSKVSADALKALIREQSKKSISDETMLVQTAHKTPVKAKMWQMGDTKDSDDEDDMEGSSQLPQTKAKPTTSKRVVRFMDQIAGAEADTSGNSSMPIAECKRKLRLDASTDEEITKSPIKEVHGNDMKDASSEEIKKSEEETQAEESPKAKKKGGRPKRRRRT